MGNEINEIPNSQGEMADVACPIGITTNLILLTAFSVLFW